MTEQEDIWKSRAEAKMRGFFGRQSWLEEETNFDKALRFGLDLSFLTLNVELERWELYGAGVDKLKRALSDNKAKSVAAISGRLLNTVTHQIETLSFWKDRAEKAGHLELLEEYNSHLFELATFKVLWVNGKEMDIALRSIEEPGYDHKQDTVLRLRKPNL